MRNLWWILAVAVLVWIGARSAANPYGAVETAFNATGASPSGYSLDDWGRISGGRTHESLFTLAAQLAARGHIAGSVRLSNGLSYQKAQVVQQVGQVSTDIIVERLASGATYAVADRASANGFYGLSQSVAWARSLLSNVSPQHLSLTLEGYIHRRLSPNAENQLVDRALRAVNAQKVNGLVSPALVSEAADTSRLSDSDTLQHHPVDLQVAVDYNAYLHATQILVGSPLITVTY